jgi:hypothetical protein
LYSVDLGSTAGRTHLKMSVIGDLRGKLDFFNSTFNLQIASHPALDAEDGDLDVEHVADLVNQIGELLDEATIVINRRVEQDDVEWE